MPKVDPRILKRTLEAELDQAIIMRQALLDAVKNIPVENFPEGTEFSEIDTLEHDITIATIQARLDELGEV
jgi:hypothetical protein